MEEKEGFGRRSNDGFELELPFGRLRATGPMVIIIVTILAAVAGAAYFGYQHDQRTQEQGAEIITAIRESVYLQTLSDAEKKNLRLAMPASMRERLLKQERERDLRDASFPRPCAPGSSSC